MLHEMQCGTYSFLVLHYIQIGTICSSAQRVHNSLFLPLQLFRLIYTDKIVFFFHDLHVLQSQVLALLKFLICSSLYWHAIIVLYHKLQLTYCSLGIVAYHVLNKNQQLLYMDMSLHKQWSWGGRTIIYMYILGLGFVWEDRCL